MAFDWIWSVGFVGGIAISLVDYRLGIVWFFAFIGTSALYQLHVIAGLLRVQHQHNEWRQKIDWYRFDHDFPDAAERTALKQQMGESSAVATVRKKTR